jgi:dihydroorotase
VILKNVQLVSGAAADIQVRDGKIATIGRVDGIGIDCAGLLALPGFVDLHTHLRQPGYESSETVASGSRSAAMGGYAAVFAMANTMPVTDTPDVAEWVFEEGKRVGLVDVKVIGAITKGLEGRELSPFEELANSNAQVRVFSDDGNCLNDRELMRVALLEAKRLGAVIAQHSQDDHQTVGAQMNAGALSLELGLTGWPASAEADVIARDAELAMETGARLHVCHVTTAEGLEVIRWAKAKGAQITAEVTPHHLLLTEELVRTYNPVYKVNPPLRRNVDVEALRRGVVDGSIDILATDHAPHSDEKKHCEWSRAANGMVGLEAAASVLQLVLIEQAGESWERFVELTSSTPAEIGNLSDQGRLEVGGTANITLMDPKATRYIQRDTHSLSKNNPWSGLKLPGKVVHTIFRGRFTVKDGQLAN